VVVGEAINQPIPTALVSVDFSHTAHMAPCRTQPNGETLDCATRTVSVISDGQGRATFLIAGACNINHAWTGPDDNLAEIRADGVVLRHVPAAVWDLDGAALNGINR